MNRETDNVLVVIGFTSVHVTQRSSTTVLRVSALLWRWHSCLRQRDRPRPSGCEQNAMEPLGCFHNTPLQVVSDTQLNCFQRHCNRAEATRREFGVLVDPKNKPLTVSQPCFKRPKDTNTTSKPNERRLGLLPFVSFKDGITQSSFY